jgi:ATP-dependent Lhr-like helicase
VRRGYFVAGLGAAQFALPGAVDRLRSARDVEASEVVVLAATDPAQPYGAALPWPSTEGRPARAAGAFVVIVGGALGVFLDRGGKSIATFGVEPADWVDGLTALLKDGKFRRIELQRVDGRSIADSPMTAALREAGFIDGYRGLQLRA